MNEGMRMLARMTGTVGVGLCFLAELACGTPVPERQSVESNQSSQQENQELHRLMTPPWIKGDASARGEVGTRVANADHQILNIVGRWWMPNLGDGDHMSTTQSSEVPNYGGDKFQGQLFYIPADPASGTHPLYRLSKPSVKDHMDSVQTDEAGHTQEGILGHPLTSQIDGTQAITRWFRPSGPQSHITARSGEIPSGYTQEAVLGYGYPRSSAGPNQHCTKNFTVQGGEVKLAFSKVAGGAVWELWWKGKQFVNDGESYGHQIQPAVFWYPGDVYNPTEAGDTRDCSTAGRWAHGSPLLSYGVESLPDGSGPKVTTYTRPIHWNPELLGGGDDQPVLWQGSLEKTVTLNSQGHGRRIRWQVDTTFPSTITCPPEFPVQCVLMEIVAGHLTDEFRRLHVFDAANNVLSENKASSLPDGPNNICLWGNEDPDLQPVAGGPIAATPDGKYALGIYHRSGDGFSHQSAFALCAWTHSTGGQYGKNTYKLDAYRSYDGVNAGTYSNTVYLAVGTIQQVRAEMMAMYDEGL